MRMIITVLLIFLSTPSYGWFVQPTIESSMKKLGFSITNKTNVPVAHSTNTTTRYRFRHRLHRNVVVEDYHNGFINIQIYLQGRLDKTKWKLRITRTVEKEDLPITAWNMFVLGDY